MRVYPTNAGEHILNCEDCPAIERIATIEEGIEDVIPFADEFMAKKYMANANAYFAKIINEVHGF